jgi:hypothetical protein
MMAVFLVAVKMRLGLFNLLSADCLILFKLIPGGIFAVKQVPAQSRPVY